MAQGDPSLRQQGLQALQEGRLKDALELLQQAAAAQPDDGGAQALLGAVHSQLGQHEEARSALTTAVALEPNAQSHRFNLAVALEQAGDHEAALDAYEACLGLDPNHSRAGARLASLRAELEAQAPPPPTPEPPVPPEPPAPPPAAPAPPPRPSFTPSLPGEPAAAPPPPPASSVPDAPSADEAFAIPEDEGEKGPPGTVKCSNCGEWSQPGLSCEFCSAGLGPPPAPPPVAPPQSEAPAGEGAAGTYASPPSYVPPAPVPVDNLGDFDRSFMDMPTGVTYARILLLFGVFCTTSGVLLVALLKPAAEFFANIGSPFAVALPVLVLIGWLYWALGKGIKTAWYVHLIYCVLNLALFPIGTVIYTYIMYLWLQEDTRDWFKMV